MRRVLALDGGGIKGVFAASFLAALESTLNVSVTDYFDLIVGTSTGGIIALGLGLGLSATEILNFYERNAPLIFAGRRSLRRLRQLGLAKYDPRPLRTALEAIFGQRTLGESRKRLVIPSFNLETGEVYIWKTAHHCRLEHDYRTPVVDVALATAAAPTYFPTFRSSTGVPLIDGGVWANNPISVAVVESIGILGWPRDDLRVLSLGCTTTPLNVGLARFYPLGFTYWALKIVDLFLTAQSTSAIGMVQHLIADRNNVVRISPVVPANRFDLDKISEIPSLRGLGQSECRKEIPRLRTMFFDQPVEEQFRPMHS